MTFEEEVQKEMEIQKRQAEAAEFAKKVIEETLAKIDEEGK